jgi:hypothetical protein
MSRQVKCGNGVRSGRFRAAVEGGIGNSFHGASFLIWPSGGASVDDGRNYFKRG